ncbi:MAG TPA: SDR family NAD(P)-dependent oxidoreductase [Lacisediminihabitans sp.]|uniref:SDR family NAD(P)-dependent oxidoreductase n=1 Tax=Lacisediminihabitans sp. TaxID=2787631 RepID=UPI002ED78C6B
MDLHGKRIIITGGASGLGVEIARTLAGAGADVTLAVRDTAAGSTVADGLNAGLSHIRVSVAELELTNLDSVRRFAEVWGRAPIDVLIDNAGIMAPPLSRTPAGWELQFATNHLGHFSLATGLHDALAEAGGRIISVSSRAHLWSPLHFDDINFDRKEYHPWIAYAQSKTANALFAVAATDQWADHGITANALNPGDIRTPLARHLDDELRRFVAAGGPVSFKTIEQGAATTVFVATSPLLDGIGGRYFEDATEAAPWTGGDRTSGVADYALDASNAERLWELSVRAVA